MTREDVIKGLEQEVARADFVDLEWIDCVEVGLLRDVLALLKAQSKFIEYFSVLYGQNLEVANWHLNGAMEPLDNFIDSAIEEMQYD